MNYFIRLVLIVFFIRLVICAISPRLPRPRHLRHPPRPPRRQRPFPLRAPSASSSSSSLIIRIVLLVCSSVAILNGSRKQPRKQPRLAPPPSQTTTRFLDKSPWIELQIGRLKPACPVNPQFTGPQHAQISERNGLKKEKRPLQFAAKPAVQLMLIPAVAERPMVAKPRLRRGRRDRQLVQ